MSDKHQLTEDQTARALLAFRARMFDFLRAHRVQPFTSIDMENWYNGWSIGALSAIAESMGVSLDFEGIGPEYYPKPLEGDGQ